MQVCNCPAACEGGFTLCIMPLMPPFRFVSNLWDPRKARGLSDVDLLIYRSNILGSDPRVVNTAGGNTSAKVWMEDPLDGKKVLFSGSRVRAAI